MYLRDLQHFHVKQNQPFKQKSVLPHTRIPTNVVKCNLCPLLLRKQRRRGLRHEGNTKRGLCTKKFVLKGQILKCFLNLLERTVEKNIYPKERS